MFVGAFVSYSGEIKQRHTSALQRRYSMTIVPERQVKEAVGDFASTITNQMSTRRAAFLQCGVDNT